MKVLSQFVVATILCFAPEAFAQDKPVPSGTVRYKATISKVVDNCNGQGLSLKSSPITVSTVGNKLSISIPTIPNLTGKVGRRGKLRANSKEKTKAEGVSSRFGINGRTTGDSLRAILMAEYFKDKKPLCTQSWSVSGSSN